MQGCATRSARGADLGRSVADRSARPARDRHGARAVEEGEVAVREGHLERRPANGHLLLVFLGTKNISEGCEGPRVPQR